jgi:hypothetical protein
VQYYEHGNWEALKNSAYDRDKMANAYWESVAWVEKIKASLND